MSKPTQDFSKIRKNILPFRIVNSVPIKDTQLLLTSRPKKVIKAPNRIRKFSPSPESILPPISTSPSLYSSTSLTMTLNSATPDDLNQSKSANQALNTFERNLINLKIMSISPSARTPKASGEAQNQIRLTSLRQIIIEDEEESPQALRDDKKIRLHSHFLVSEVQECKGELPKSQEYCGIVYIPGKLYLVESCGRKGRCDIHELKPKTNTWRLGKCSENPNSRFGYSLLPYLDNIVMYGGLRAESQCKAKKSSSHCVYFYSTVNNQWKRRNGKGNAPAARRSHACAGIGRFMFVYGGVDNNSNVLDDLSIFDMLNHEWILPEITILNDPGPRSHCSLTAIYNPEHQKLESKELFQLSLKENSGFYLFGGLSNGKPCNSLHVLSIKKNIFYWSNVMYRGQAPVARFSHTACAIGLKLFIFGGRNDSLYETGLEFLGLSVFNASNIEWERVNLKGETPSPRWGHGMHSVSSKLVIFGGIFYNKIMESKLYTIETDWYSVKNALESNN